MDMQTIEIRDARPEERDRAAEIAVAAFARLGALADPEEAARMADRVRATTRDPGTGRVIVALHDGRLVGSVVYNSPGAGQHPLFPDGWSFIRSVAVEAANAGRGIGRRLVEACIARAQHDRARWIGLYAADSNIVALGLYRDMGFRQTGEAPSYWGLTYHVWGLELSGE